MPASRRRAALDVVDVGAILVQVCGHVRNSFLEAFGQAVARPPVEQRGRFRIGAQELLRA